MSARHLGGAGLTWSVSDWTLATSLSHIGRRPLRDNTLTPQELPAYTLVNVAASWRVMPQLTVQVGVDNLTDVVYINDDFSAQEAGNAGAPRSAFVRVRAEF
jgi:outer membrane receptor protein involved in Fe transport